MGTSSIQEVFDGFLAALCEPEGGEVFHGMHAADAIVRYAEGVGPARGIDRGEFARAHREIGLGGQNELPHFACKALLQAPVDKNARDTVAWFEVIETREQRSLIAALG
ncbi:MAG: hypothetical protein ACRETD_02485, partial [Steroidobacteraceae bacterium]